MNSTWIVKCFVIGLAITVSGLTCHPVVAQDSEEPAMWCVYQGADGVGAGKHVVLISGDDEYRSEEAMPMLGKILARHHGFKCTVLFPIDPEDGTIKPDHQTNITDLQALESEDVVIIGLRFRNLPDEQMKYFVDYLESGKPMIGLRTSTHAFRYPDDSKSPYRHYSFNSDEWQGGFGQQVLGDTWVSHHGRHKRESTRGVIVDANASHPVLRGVTDVWGPTDVYGIKRLPNDATVLMQGAVLEGMKPTDKPVAGEKNDPMMPLVWIKSFENDSGKKNNIFCTTMGSSTDFESEHLRRLIVNATYWAAGLQDKIDGKANVEFVDAFKPTPYGFGNYQKGLKPKDFAW